LADLRVPVEDARLPTRGCAHAGVRALAWGGVAVVGRNQRERGKGAVGPPPEGLSPVRGGPRARHRCEGKGAVSWWLPQKGNSKKRFNVYEVVDKCLPRLMLEAQKRSEGSG
jgi:hypothetical protein